MRICYAACLLFVSLSLYGQGYDSLVTFNELTFSSEFERETFTRLQNRDVDVFALLIANGNLLTDAKIRESKAMFYDHINTITVDESKKNEKRVKYVYDNLHKKFLRKFELKNRFEEVFHNGYFNSVSAAAVLAMAFDKLKIPYTIKEESTQVYLIAYPQEEKIVLRNLPEMGGYFEINDEFKQNYIKRLKEQKLIDPQEYASSSLKDLFDRYYFEKSADVDLLKLAGIQYMNDALYLCGEHKFETAFTQVEKAYLLYPSPRAAYLLMITGAQAFENHKAKDSVQATQLSKLSRYSDYGMEQDIIVGEFARVTQSLLFEAGSKEKYIAYYNVLTRSIQNFKLKDQLAFHYNYELGRYYYNQAKFKEAVPSLERAIVLKPNDLDVQSLFLEALAKTFVVKENQDIIKSLEEYNSKYPSLQSNNNFNTMRAATYLIQFNHSYNFNKIAEGDKCKASFEDLLQKYPDIVVNPDLVGQSYSAAAVYYYRKSQVAKAKQLIVTGLKYAPNSYELRQRQMMIK